MSITKKFVYALLALAFVIVILWNQSNLLRDIKECMDVVPQQQQQQSHITIRPNMNVTKPRIAIISSFLVGEQSTKSRIKDLDHIVNKVCYAKLWGYDFILNMTYGFDKDVDEELGGAFWLNYGTWHRVPHIRDRITDYDWILYADTDYVINDMKSPLESFFKNWELHGMNPSVLIPKDFDDGYYTFSAFVVLIKNHPFGRTVLDHWMDFGRGICPNGNFVDKKRKYAWQDSDQPGLWYALTQTHKDFANFTGDPVCNNETGLIISNRAFGPEMNKYFASVGAVRGSDGSDLLKVPKHQPIIWSRPNIESMSGIGLQYKWGKKKNEYLMEDFAQIFAFHNTDVNSWSEKSKRNLELCKTVHGCYARYNTHDMIEIGCDGVEYTVAHA
jgi:hypothetical protein